MEVVVSDHGTVSKMPTRTLQNHLAASVDSEGHVFIENADDKPTRIVRKDRKGGEYEALTQMEPGAFDDSDELSSDDAFEVSRGPQQSQMQEPPQGDDAPSELDILAATGNLDGLPQPLETHTASRSALEVHEEPPTPGSLLQLEEDRRMNSNASGSLSQLRREPDISSNASSLPTQPSEEEEEPSFESFVETQLPVRNTHVSMIEASRLSHMRSFVIQRVRAYFSTRAGTVQTVVILCIACIAGVLLSVIILFAVKTFESPVQADLQEVIQEGIDEFARTISLGHLRLPDDETDEETSNDEEVRRVRPCAGGCGFQATWHDTYCCFRCEQGQGHGDRCDMKPIDQAPTHPFK